MSDLPQIDSAKVAQRLSLKLAESLLQMTQMELLAEMLRDERDEARSTSLPTHNTL